MTTLQIFLMVLIGLFTGAVTGLTGASGVMVVVPLATVLLNFPIHQAIGTSLIVDVLAPLAISYTYYKHGNIDIKSGIWIALGSVLGAQLGAYFAAGVSAGNLGGAFGIFMIIMGIILWRNGINREVITKKMKRIVKFETQTQRIITALILGFFVGLLTGFLGAGGGGIVLLILIFVLDFPLHKAIGTSALIMAITACSGAIGYGLHGNTNILSGLILGFIAAASGVISAKFANKINEEVLAKTVGVIFVLLGALTTFLQFKS
ncbi:MAG TPA: sulfite exporter TauE/SafE family protein [Candidatus Pacearchaeota archaeon]|nr:sulfite exporter TauE/SafE family protein [Candidatus Pacearchaeota archaeon]HOK93944.1 sulfite exporter TauE/SafE family protein [Candidatus Pacearchaeota archaeon]HPO75015.1 sulfite exporter TauE/SafE family protein [Candidatus Pacearchaeota archaeon]